MTPGARPATTGGGAQARAKPIASAVGEGVEVSNF